MKETIVNFTIFMIFSVIAFAAPAFAQLEGNPENLCRNGFFPRESRSYRLARITGKKDEKVHFYGDEREDCPNGKNCRLKSYLIPGDEIIVSRTFGDFACAWFQPKKGSETVGWIPSGNIEFLPEKTVAAGDWLGNWRYYENSIEIFISKNKGFFKVTGNAVWKGLGDNVHVGELDNEAAATGNQLNIGENDSDDDCRVSMRLLGKYLIVADNLRCGGVNVTFSGVYRKNSK